jgi:HEAT repeat protein
MIYFCPSCWNEIKNEDVCPECGVDLKELAQEGYEEKLIRALRHPEPTTPARAATLLGEIGSKDAVGPLMELMDSSPDPYIQEAAAIALGRIGDSRALLCLERWSAEGAVRVRLAAQQAIQSIRGEKGQCLSETERSRK